MAKLSKLTAAGVLLASTVFATTGAWAAPSIEVKEKPVTTQDIYQQTVEAAPPSLAQIVITDRRGVQTLEAPDRSSLKTTLRQNGLKPASYKGEDGKKLDDVPVTAAAPTFLFKTEYRGTAAQIEIPAPMSEVRVDGIPEGDRIEQSEGQAGIGILTTVFETDLSADKFKNDEASAGKRVEKSETLTVVKAPVPGVVLVGARDNLTDTASVPTAPVAKECENGTSVPATVDSDIIAIHQAVCAQFPDITTYGTYRDSCPVTCDHHDGLAVDIMTSGDTGWLVANYLTANYALYDINYLIYEQQIWEPGRPYWRAMEDRGSPTANHMDHVHVSVYR